VSKGGRPRLFAPDDEKIWVSLPAWVCRRLRDFAAQDDLTDAQIARAFVIDRVHDRLRRRKTPTT